MSHKKPTRKRKPVQPKQILEWVALITAILTMLKLLVELIQLLT